jgi:hypothetical protein
MFPRLIRLALALLCALAATTATAVASPTMELGLSDDRLLGYDDEADAQRTVAQWRDSGVDVVRIIARWGAVAPEPDAMSAPGGFDPEDHTDARYDWARIDRSVRFARGAGLKVIMTVTGWGPVWGTRNPERDNPRHDPDPARFAEFAKAVATRYGADVDDYIVWNEPNQPLWLQPQRKCSGGRCTPAAPHMYRRILAAADPALRAADPGARIHIGALAPRGLSGRKANDQLRPGVFLRAFACVDSRYRSVRTGDCRGFRRPTGNGFAYHPHSGKLTPSTRSRLADEYIFGDLGELTGVLDRLTRNRRLAVRGASRFPLHLTEFGYQTSPPDRQLGVGTLTQAALLAQSASIASRNPRVRTIVQYVWRDEPVGPSGGGWQSGMYYTDGRPKPALTEFPQPFWVDRTGRGKARVWGQVRPGTTHTVTLERRSGSSWRRVASIRTNSKGVFTRNTTIRSRTTYRFRWDGGTSLARTVSP